MNAKTITRIALLAVVGIAVGSWAMREFGPAKAVVNSVTSDQPAMPDGVTVINFHGGKRCRTCIAIGDLAKRTIDTEFASERKSGKVRWEQINYDDPLNAHFVKHYGLVSSTVVATLWRDGKEIEWSRLDAVWDHIDDESAFRAYLTGAVRELLDHP